ncbi:MULTISPECIES: HEAT repeat domain-containing protein [Pseudothermotoga]|jgi:HEAT repeat protein|uniref:HEAT domain containing protein n=1 Tax=Pseudothermotoga lettingae (strain ATCC BAA-301 / DSM 14385 / NBRC 107922 / TMO) TaxID=416591 RepID=A8F495_PSELT|nr:MULTISPECIES: HEAT repeat domain-containing protein [Pseudothermotoga]ABV32979.1 HEAT domain containing protein [Pseudothermotoga lettingae TMO]KUK21976.1 MAG: HEAT domain containing protein [Pseudothermotoga lettingae]MDI3494241.1 hypothetical protein [Pseudothermotoga sp.]MDK2883985.1 hypothetical protein [Pseudothermotoga sp.]GLI48019.1 hypothetical protein PLETTINGATMO_01880 [Pseudothermotoga lettingae TMO]
MDLDNYKSLIERIVTEKGVDAIPKLVELLTDENDEVREIAFETIQRFGDNAKPILLKIFKDRVHRAQQNDIVLLYLIDVLADMEEKCIKQDLYQLLSRYDNESAQLVIYEALAKLGDGDTVIDILCYFVLEDEYKDQLAEQAIMALAHIPSEKSLNCLVDAYKNKSFSTEIRQDIIKAISMITMKNPALWDKFTKLNEPELVEKVRQFVY